MDMNHTNKTPQHRAPEGECSLCDKARATGGMETSHDASKRCQSGGRNHCSCDTCF
jgi:hypothetical protein